MGYRVDLEKHYYHPRTHKRLSIEKAKLYMRRTGKMIKPQVWLTTRHTVSDRSFYLSDRQYVLAKRMAGRIAYTARLTRQESILTAKSLSTKRVREVLANHRVFSRLYEDFETPGDAQRRGAVKLTVHGTLDGRRIKEVIHLGFQRTVWQERHGNEERARESFKDWIVGSVLSNLRRRGLRISNPKQSADRITDLQKDRHDLQADLDRAVFMEDVKGQAKIQMRIDWHTKAIADQKKTRQLRGVTIRVEKLV